MKVGDRVRWCMKVQGYKMYGVTAGKWGTITRVVDTGLPEPITLDLPLNMEHGKEYTLPSRPGKLLYIRWDGAEDVDEHPYLELNLEAEDVIKSLGKIVNEDE